MIQQEWPLSIEQRQKYKHQLSVCGACANDKRKANMNLSNEKWHKPKQKPHKNGKIT